MIQMFREHLRAQSYFCLAGETPARQEGLICDSFMG